MDYEPKKDSKHFYLLVSLFFNGHMGFILIRFHKS